MEKNIKLILFITFFPFYINAQTNEMGIMTGVSQYQGDLAARGFTPEGTNLALGAYYQKDFLKNFSAKFSYIKTKLEGNDGFASNNLVPRDQFRKYRNLSFYSHVSEFDITVNFNLFSFSNKNKRKFNPYVFGGVGLFTFNPKTIYQGKEYELRNLPTELNKPQYALTQITIPMGLGIKKIFKKNWIVGAFFQFNYTFTDYIDDVSAKWSDYTVISENYGNNIAILGHRYKEIDPNSPTRMNNDNSPVNRGKKSKKDTYYYVGFTIAKRFYIRKPPTTDGLYRGGEFQNINNCPK